MLSSPAPPPADQSPPISATSARLHFEQRSVPRDHYKKQEGLRVWTQHSGWDTHPEPPSSLHSLYSFAKPITLRTLYPLRSQRDWIVLISLTVVPKLTHKYPPDDHREFMVSLDTVQCQPARSAAEKDMLLHELPSLQSHNIANVPLGECCHILSPRNEEGLDGQLLSIRDCTGMGVKTTVDDYYAKMEKKIRNSGRCKNGPYRSNQQAVLLFQLHCVNEANTGRRFGGEPSCDHHSTTRACLLSGYSWSS